MAEPTGQENPLSSESSNKQKSYIELVRDTNQFDTEWLADTELQKKQEAILSQLPELHQLARELSQHVIKERESEVTNARRLGIEPRHSAVRSLIRGELLERLVTIENRLYISQKRPAMIVDGTDRWAEPELEEAITEALKNPPFGSLINKRKPDLSYVEIRKGKKGNLAVFTGTGEVKSSRKLNKRAFAQLGPSGFRRTLEKFTEEVNSLTTKEAEQKGLKGFGRGGLRLAILQHFTQYVYMCRDIDTTDSKKLIDRYGHDPSESMTDEEYNRSLNILSGNDPESHVLIRKAAFSEKELDRLHGSVLPLVESILSSSELNPDGRPTRPGERGTNRPLNRY